MADIPVPSAPEQNPPNAHIGLTRSAAEIAYGWKPGKAVRVVLYGKLMGIDMHKSGAELPGFTGSLSLEIYEMNVAEDPGGVYRSMLDGEDE